MEKYSRLDLVNFKDTRNMIYHKDTQNLNCLEMFSLFCLGYAFFFVLTIYVESIFAHFSISSAFYTANLWMGFIGVMLSWTHLSFKFSLPGELGVAVITCYLFMSAKISGSV